VSRFSAWRALAAVCLAFLVGLVPLVLLGIAFAFVLINCVVRSMVAAARTSSLSDICRTRD